MYRAEGHPKILAAVAILLIALVVKPAMAGTTTLPSSQVLDLTTSQRELSKRQQTSYLKLCHSETVSTDNTLLESSPGDIAAGSLVGRVEILAAAH
ncbi:MAG: hypothetical protein JSV47_00130, partial [Deltaproteobacteria bacterium]